MERVGVAWPHSCWRTRQSMGERTAGPGYSRGYCCGRRSADLAPHPHWIQGRGLASLPLLQRERG